MINYFYAGKNNTIGDSVWFRRAPWFNVTRFGRDRFWYCSFGWLWWCVQFGKEPTLLPEPRRRAVALYWRNKQQLPIAPEEFTCWNCKQHGDCESAWDAYNTDGDCLEMK